MSWKHSCFDWETADAEENKSNNNGVTGIFLNVSMCCRYKKSKIVY